MPVDTGGSTSSRPWRRGSLSIGVIAAAIGGWWLWFGGTDPRNLPAEITEDEYRLAAQAWELDHGRKPNRGEVFYHLAQRARSAGNHEKAVACFTQIPETHRRRRTAHFHQGVLLARLNRVADAEEHLRAFLRFSRRTTVPSPKRLLRARLILKNMLIAQLRYREWQNVLREILRRDQATAKETLDYCFPSLATGTYPLVVSLVEDWLEKDPANFRLRVALGRHRLGQGRLKEARRILEQCCRERPDDLTAQAARLACLLRQGEWESAEENLHELPPFSHSEPPVLTRVRGDLHNHFGRYREAANIFRRALKSNPTDPDCYRGLIRAYAGLGVKEKRCATARQLRLVVRIQKNMHAFHAAMTDQTRNEMLAEIAELCEQLGWHERALLVAGALRKRDPDSPGLDTFTIGLDNETATPLNADPSTQINSRE